MRGISEGGAIGDSKCLKEGRPSDGRTDSPFGVRSTETDERGRGSWVAQVPSSEGDRSEQGAGVEKAELE